MNALPHQIAERGVDRALALEAGHAGEGVRFDLHREMAFAAAVVAGVAVMLRAVIDHREMRGSEGGAQAFLDFPGDRAVYCSGHGHLYRVIGAIRERGLASAGKKQARFHGRIEGRALHCAEPGCDAPGEFRAPGVQRPGFDGPGDWRWLCLDHVREFNATYNWFEGMSPDEISAAQTPYGGWERETRAFGAARASSGPRWADFVDPLDAIGARFEMRNRAERPDGKPVSDGERRHLATLGLGPDADRKALRTRYAQLLRRYHPDHNGGDRSHEKALSQVIEAYTALKSRPLFA